MPDWDAKAQSAVSHMKSRKRTFSEDQSFGLVDFLAEKGAVSEVEMQAHGSADFIRTILGHVTTAVHGGGDVPVEGGWYSHPAAGKPYTIDPEFAVAWVKARAE